MRLNWSKLLCIRPSSIDISEFKTKVNFYRSKRANSVSKLKIHLLRLASANSKRQGGILNRQSSQLYLIPVESITIVTVMEKNAYEQCNTFSLLSLQPRLIFVVKYWRFNSIPLIRHRVTPNSRLWWNMKTTAHTSFVLQMQSLRQSTHAKGSHSLVSNLHELTAEPRF